MPSEKSKNGEPESEIQIGSRDGKIQLIQSWFIPLLDAPKWKEKYEPDPASVENSEEMLAEQYHDLAVPEVNSTLVLLVFLAIIDYLMVLDAQVYGLFIDVWAAIFLIFPSLKGRYVLASAVDGTPKDAIYRLEAQEMVSTNAGFAFLTFGFVLQIVSVQFLPTSEFLRANLLTNFVPSWLTVVMLVLTIWIGLKTLTYFRDRRFAAREEAEGT